MTDYPVDSKPHINWNHVDGPLLTCRDATPHFLTKVESCWMEIGFTSIDLLDEKYTRS